VAHWLRDRGFDAYAVRGGVAALDAGLATEVEPAAEDGGGRSLAIRGGLAALRHRPFRIYSAGLLVSLTGNWVEGAAFGYVVLLLGGSASTLGVIGFLSTIPNLVFALPAGALADRYDQRRLLFAYQGACLVVAALLAALWATGSLSLGLIAALGAISGILGTLSFPAFQGMLASTVPRRDLESAVAIDSLSLQVARFVGPALAGFLLAAAGPTWVFAVNAASFLAVLVSLALLPGSTGLGSSAVRVGGAIGEALRFVFGGRSLAGLMALMLFAGLFGTPPVAFMIPALVRDQLDGGAGTLGSVSAAVGLGSLLGAAALIVLSRRVNKGQPLVAGYLVTALAIAGIGVSASVALSLVLALVGGFTGVVFVGLSTVVVQSMAPSALRARAMAVWAACFVGVLPFGALVTAGLTALVGSGWAVAIDGIAALAGGLIVLVTRPEITWLGCAALPEACLAGIQPAAVAFNEEEGETAREAA
jgi:MFS family permease